MMVAPRKREDFKECEIENLIKEKHKIMKKIISLEKEYFLSNSEDIQDPSPEIILNVYNEELEVISNLIEELTKKQNNKDIYI